MRRLLATDKLGSKPALSRIRLLCKMLGNPQNKFKSIIVGGTNGKGSTTAMLSATLSTAGYRAGAYFSPHVFDFCERVTVDGKKISKKDFAKSLHRVFRAIDANAAKFKSGAPTFFEIVTAAAFLHFARMRVDYAVLEVGMGGRLDATNICHAQMSVITSIGMDHTRFLGDTIGQIAFEKGGIAKKGKWLVCASGIPLGARIAIFSHARKCGAKIAVPSAFDALVAATSKPSLRGAFQEKNATTAACAARLLGIMPRTIASGISKASLPARLQQISSSPTVILDSAHNPDGARALFASLPPIIGKLRPRILLFSSMKDKDYAATLSALRPNFDAVVAFSPPLPRAETPAKLALAAKRARFKKIALSKSPKSALSCAKKLAGKSGAVVACGSMYSFTYLLGLPCLPVSQ